MALIFGTHALRSHLGVGGGDLRATVGLTLLTLGAVAPLVWRAGSDSPAPFDVGTLSRVSRAALAPADAPRLGDRDTEGVVVMFGDLTCFACRDAYHRMRRTVRPGGAALVFRHFPLPLHPEAFRAATLAEAARERGRFWPFLDGVFENEAYSEETARGLLAGWGVAGSDRASVGGWRSRVLADERLARRLGFRVTPTLLLLSPNRTRVVSLDEAVGALATR